LLITRPFTGCRFRERLRKCRAGLNYGEEVHKSVNNFSPIQGYIFKATVEMAEEVRKTRFEKEKRKRSFKVEFFGGQVFCPRN
jgi:hypothetical protein